MVESNVADGMMVWQGNLTVGRGGAMTLDVHKTSIAGRAASACERQTNLHVVFPPGMSQSVAPFSEVNCAGTTSTGEVRLQRFSPSQSTIVGTFYEDGARLGPFEARKL